MIKTKNLCKTYGKGEESDNSAADFKLHKSGSCFGFSTDCPNLPPQKYLFRQNGNATIMQSIDMFSNLVRLNE